MQLFLDQVGLGTRGIWALTSPRMETTYWVAVHGQGFGTAKGVHRGAERLTRYIIGVEPFWGEKKGAG